MLTTHKKGFVCGEASKFHLTGQGNEFEYYEVYQKCS